MSLVPPIVLVPPVTLVPPVVLVLFVVLALPMVLVPPVVVLMLPTVLVSPVFHMLPRDSHAIHGPLAACDLRTPMVLLLPVVLLKPRHKMLLSLSANTQISGTVTSIKPEQAGEGQRDFPAQTGTSLHWRVAAHQSIFWGLA